MQPFAQIFVSDGLQEWKKPWPAYCSKIKFLQIHVYRPAVENNLASWAVIKDEVLEDCINFSGSGHILKDVFVEQIAADINVEEELFLVSRARGKRASGELPLQAASSSSVVRLHEELL